MNLHENNGNIDTFSLLDMAISSMVASHGPTKIAGHLATHIIACCEELDLPFSQMKLSTRNKKKEATITILIEDSKDDSPYVDGFNQELN